MGKAAASQSIEPRTDQSVFEGLFTNALKPSGKFADDLVAIGYNPQRPERTYPTRVWVAALQVACHHTFPDLPETEAQNRLGRMYIRGFLDTIIGRLIGVSLQVLGPEALIKRLPRWASMSATGIEIAVAPVSPGVWKGTWKDANPLPEFILGVMQEGGTAVGFTSVEIVEKRADGFDLVFHLATK